MLRIVIIIQAISGQKSTILDHLGNCLRYCNSDCGNELPMPQNIGFDTSITSLDLFNAKLQNVGKNSAILDNSYNQMMGDGSLV